MGRQATPMDRDAADRIAAAAERDPSIICCSLAFCWSRACRGVRHVWHVLKRGLARMGRRALGGSFSAGSSGGCASSSATGTGAATTRPRPWRMSKARTAGAERRA